MEATAQSEVKLHEGISKTLEEAGYESPPYSLNPNDTTPLERVKEAVGVGAKVVGSMVEEGLEGKGPQTHMGVTKLKGGRLARWVLNRFHRKEQ